ncbi:hypothetical protein M409DRAFT_17382 [Zasmidium cellare ATCC 36951]|uniref:Uncharacterized protein n=1 Tax=Zasmidium cellare ATCC 36951 TaxID=1080233 RepID=A0A6A6D1T7_ZASCE|nr:uncharacterized protein M409DRAFT_17382 [Zasmidium cellare ATCC 36951]KAF2172142.1 hypothetical protein M409DRAFT_17382 [Zasmidium cellare ATCC 36951]
MQDFYDKYFEAICTNQCEDPLILQLRKAVESLDDSNYEQVNADVVSLLSELPPMIDKPKNVDGLMFVLTKATSNRAKSQSSDEMASLAVMLHKSNINAPQHSKAESAALSLGMPAGFIPEPNNPYYAAHLTLANAAMRMFKVCKGAQIAAQRWKEAMIHQGLLFRDWMRKTTNPKHGFRQLGRDLRHMWELLDNGRAGWRFIELPHHFYHDVLPRLTDFVNTLQEVAVATQNQLLRKAVSTAHEIGKRLNLFQRFRWEAEEACRLHYEKQRAKTDAKTEEDMRALMEQMSFYGKTTDAEQLNGEGMDVDEGPGCFELEDLKALMEKEHTDMEGTGATAGDEEVDYLDLDV